MFGHYLILAFMIVALGVITAAIAIVAMAIALLRPPRMTDGKAIWVLRRLSPGDLGLTFRDVEFTVRDEQTQLPMKIAGWWMPHPAAQGKCVVLLHGYADAKVGVIAWAPLWQSMGYNVLAIDLRAHGESEGVHCTAGFWERHDLCQVLDQLRAERANDTRRVVLFGVSLGAATALAAGAMRDDLTAIVLESPPADFCTSAISHMNHLGTPGRCFQSTALGLAERLAMCNFEQVRPTDLLLRIGCPVMIISPSDDPMVDESEQLMMRRSLESRNNPKDAFWQVCTGHMLALHAEKAEYERRLADFLSGCD